MSICCINASASRFLSPTKSAILIVTSKPGPWTRQMDSINCIPSYIYLGKFLKIKSSNLGKNSENLLLKFPVMVTRTYFWINFDMTHFGIIKMCKHLLVNRVTHCKGILFYSNQSGSADFQAEKTCWNWSEYSIQIKPFYSFRGESVQKVLWHSATLFV
jgi:hypothetical protein